MSSEYVGTPSPEFVNIQAILRTYRRLIVTSFVVACVAIIVSVVSLVWSIGFTDEPEGIPDVIRAKRIEAEVVNVVNDVEEPIATGVYIAGDGGKGVIVVRAGWKTIATIRAERFDSNDGGTRFGGDITVYGINIDNGEVTSIRRVQLVGSTVGGLIGIFDENGEVDAIYPSGR